VAKNNSLILHEPTARYGFDARLRDTGDVTACAVITRNARIGGLCAASCLTHPLAWYIASVLAPDEYVPGLWLIEAVWC